MLTWPFRDYYHLERTSSEARKLFARARVAKARQGCDTIRCARDRAFEDLLGQKFETAIPVLYALHALPRRTWNRRELRTATKVLWSFFVAQERWDLAEKVVARADATCADLLKNEAVARESYTAHQDQWRSALRSPRDTKSTPAYSTWLRDLYRAQGSRQILAAASDAMVLEGSDALETWVARSFASRFPERRHDASAVDAVYAMLAEDLHRDLAWQLRVLPLELLPETDTSPMFDAPVIDARLHAGEISYALEDASFLVIDALADAWKLRKADANGKTITCEYSDWVLLGKTALAVDALSPLGSEAFDGVRSPMWNCTFDAFGKDSLNSEFRYVAYRWLSEWAIDTKHVDAERLADNARIERKLAFG